MDDITLESVKEVVSNVESDLFDKDDLEVIAEEKIDDIEDIDVSDRIEVDIITDIFEDEFTCMRCFLIKKQSFLSDKAPADEPYCTSCE